MRKKPYKSRLCQNDFVSHGTDTVNILRSICGEQEEIGIKTTPSLHLTNVMTN